MSEPAAIPAAPRRALTSWEWRVVWLLVLCFALRGLPWRLDDLDQAKQANVSLEMIEAGHWWFQHTPGGRLVATKPPLVGWMSAGVYVLPFSNWDLAWRLPSLVAALGLAYLLWRAGEALWPGRGGVVAMAGYGFNLMAPRLATLVRTDMPLTFFITAVGLIVWHHARDGGQRPWTTLSRRAVFWMLLAGMMTKGPIVYAFLLPGMLIHSWVTGRRGERMTPLWGGWWHWTLPLVPFLLWVFWGMASVPGFYAEVVGKEFFGRFTVGEHAVHKSQPVYLYVTQLCKQWLPWNVLLLAVTIHSRRLWNVLCREPGALWLVCWAAGGLALMSLVPSKRTDRIFPVVPPLALVLTALLARASRPEETPPAVAVPPTPDAAPPPPVPVVAVPIVPRWPWEWASRTTVIAVVLGLGSVVYYIAHTYLSHEHARASFAAHVRRMEAGKQVGLVTAKASQETDETMLVYLRRLSYLSPADAINDWRDGKLDALVVSENARAEFGGLLDPFGPNQPVLETAGSKPTYFLLARPRPTPNRQPTPPPHESSRRAH